MLRSGNGAVNITKKIPDLMELIFEQRDRKTSKWVIKVSDKEFFRGLSESGSYQNWLSRGLKWFNVYFKEVAGWRIKKRGNRDVANHLLFKSRQKMSVQKISDSLGIENLEHPQNSKDNNSNNDNNNN